MMTHPAFRLTVSVEATRFKRQPNRLLATTLLIMAFCTGSAALALDPAVELEPLVTEHGDRVFSLEGQPAIVNASGSLQPDMIIAVAAPDDSGLLFRVIYTSPSGETMDIQAGATGQQRSWLTVNTAHSRWSMRWNPDHQAVFHGLLEPRDPSHAAAVIERGIDVARIHEDMQSAMPAEDIAVNSDFLSFRGALEQAYAELLPELDTDQLVYRERQRLVQLSLRQQGLPEHAQIEIRSDESTADTPACWTRATAAAGGAMDAWSREPACQQCLDGQQARDCRICAASMTRVAAPLIQGQLECF